MALFTLNDIGNFLMQQTLMRNKEFCLKYSHVIENELDYMEKVMREGKSYFVDIIMKKIDHTKTAEVAIDHIYSYNFSNVGPHSPATYQSRRLDEIWRTDNMSYIQHATTERPESFRKVNDYEHLSRFRIWKSEGFLTALAKRLELPSYMHFRVHSAIIDSEVSMFENEDITEYLTSLLLVIRFSK